ncbi:hypothetical protein QYM36_013526, partial [Artemia franciscana]
MERFDLSKPPEIGVYNSIFDNKNDNSVVNNSLSACYSCLHDVSNTPIPNDVEIGFMNTQGLLSSMNEIITLFPSKSVSILGVCEYFLNEITVTNVKVPGYVFTAKNRSTKRKGGLGFFIKEEISFRGLSDIERFNTEMLCEIIANEFKLGLQTVQACVVHRPLSSSVNDFLVIFEKLVESLAGRE